MSDFDRNVAARGGFVRPCGSGRCGPARPHDPRLQLHGGSRGADRRRGLVHLQRGGDRDRGELALTPFGQTLFSGPALIVLMLGTLGLVFFLSFRINRLQYTTALTVFMVYAALLGVTLSSIFLVYTGASITRVFFISAASFGALSLWGYTTQRDLTGMGSFLIMGLFGLIIAMIVNIFLKSSGLDFIISAAGVLIFAGLTAWDTQKIKEMYDSRDDATRRRPQGRDGRAVALPRLHQPVH